MARHTNIKTFGAAMEARFKQVRLTATTVHKELYEGGARDHMEFTAGQIKERDLRAAGHPFARQGNAQRGNQTTKRLGGKRGLRVNGLPINVQTGRLRDSFYQTRPMGINKVVRMGFRAPYAKYVLSPTGTRYMIARGFYTSGGKLGAVRMRHRLRLAVAKKIYRAMIKKKA